MELPVLMRYIVLDCVDEAHFIMLDEFNRKRHSQHGIQIYYDNVAVNYLVGRKFQNFRVE